MSDASTGAGGVPEGGGRSGSGKRGRKGKGAGKKAAAARSDLEALQTAIATLEVKSGATPGSTAGTPLVSPATHKHRFVRLY